MPPSIELHIEELVLHGFAPGDHPGISEAVQRELVRLLGERGVPPSLTHGVEVARLDGGSFPMTPHLKAEAIGAHVAQAVGRGLNL
jgi:hypothetical protein